METITYDNAPIWADVPLTEKQPRSIDKTLQVEFNGSKQQVRICAADASAPPVLVIQAGPGFPTLHEVRKFQRTLALERKLTVFYWDQRGCGAAKKQDAENVSFQQQVNDVRAFIRWANENSGQKVTLLSVSLGSTFSIIAAEQEQDKVKALIAISPDINLADMDASVAAFLSERAASMPRPRRFISNLKKLGDPPYLDPALLQLRARLLTDSGAIESGKSFAAAAAEFLFGLVRAYGPIGAVTALRNMNVVQRRLLSELAERNVLTDLPPLDFPVHCVLGGKDPLVPTSARERLADLPGYSVTNIPEAGHMAHFDHPDIVSSIVLRAAGRD